MEIRTVDEGSTAHVALIGRLDIQGAEAVALPLATLSGAKQNIVIDMSKVSFLASIGIRHLVSAAKALARRGGQLVLVAPHDAVREVLTTAGLASMIAMVGNEAEARAKLAS
jgi:anti-anti-sigma factor